MAGVSLADGIPLPLAIPFWEGSGLHLNEHAVSILVLSHTCIFRCPFVTKLSRLSFNTGSLCVNGRAEEGRGGEGVCLLGESSLQMPFSPRLSVVARALSGSPTLYCGVE